ncbi:MAG: hypothetical protein R6U15_00945 [Candidatus Izemoplasmatales bacterium]
MAKYTLSSFIISLILISLVVTGFAYLISDFNSGYTTTNYDNSSLTSFNKMDELSNLSKSMKDKTELEVDSNIIDIIGSYFTSAYQALRSSLVSIDLFTSMANDVGEESGINNIKIIITALISMVFIAIFVGVFISAMVKRDV